MNLSDLPQFHIEHIIEKARDNVKNRSEVKVRGTVSPSTDVHEGRYWLYVSLAESVIGDLTFGDDPGGKASFVGSTTNDNPYLRVGCTLPLLDGYWNANLISFILDPKLQWEQVDFKPSDAIESKAPGYRVLAKRSSHKSSDAGEVIPAGWDHEHCEICLKHISAESPRAYVRENHWICLRCYEKYVIPHDLAFIVE